MHDSVCWSVACQRRHLSWAVDIGWSVSFLATLNPPVLPPVTHLLFEARVISSPETQIAPCKSCNGQRCFSYRGAKMWNDLPEKTKQTSSLYCFKKIFRVFSSFLHIVIDLCNSFIVIHLH